MGQNHVIKTLQNAIRLSKVAHAYLFCGTRGTGKTTTARLLAKALNCEKGPTPTPCNVCSACKSITEGSAMDIVELDAASHRGIGDIKDINENVKYPPMELRYKVFIIDEAHQLSNDAKDAFLKTLEEPPAHAIFILATTEPQSIPVTIRSRCQQFDFRRGSLRDLKERIKYVTDSEGVKADDAALDMIAVNADGSYRDALSLLEQILAYTDGQVSVDDINAVLGTVTQDFLFDLADIIAAGNEQAAFEAASDAVGSGKEIQQLLRSTAQHFRNLMFALVAKNLSDLTTSEEMAARMRTQASKFTRQSLLKIVEIFTQAERDARHSDQHRLLLELALLKAIDATCPVEHVPAPVSAPAPTPRVASPAPSYTPQREPQQPVQRPAKPEPVAPPKPEPAAKPTAEAPKEEAPAARHAPAAQQNLPEFDKIVLRWNAILQHVKHANKLAHALLAQAAPADIKDGALVLRFQHKMHAEMMNKDGANDKKQALLDAIHKVFGVANPRVIFETGGTEPTPARVQEDRTPPPEDEQPDLYHDRGQDTLNSVLEIYPNSQIVDKE